MSDDLVTWLRARLDEDEQAALRLQPARPGPWIADYDYAGPMDGVGVNAANGELVLVGRGYLPAEFAAEWNPARVLAEVAAKRAIVDAHDPDWPRTECPTCCGYDGNDNYGVERRPRVAYPCRVVRWLAQPYADRPGFRDEWRVPLDS